MAMEESNVIDITSRQSLDLTRAYTIACGSPIIPRFYQQPVKTAEALHDFAKATESSFLAEMGKVARALKLTIQYPGVKSISRIAQKAQVEKDGLVEEVFDAQRIALIGHRPSNITKAIDFFSPSRNSAVVSMVNQFAVPDEESRIRRAKIIIYSPSGIYSEVQIWSSAMLNAFEESHVPYEHQRKLKADLQNSASALPYKTYAQLSVKEKILGQTRRSIHDQAALDAGLDKFIETRTFGRIGDTPIVVIERPLDTHATILRPDVKSGCYVVDNSLYGDVVTGNYKKTSQQDFLHASRMMVINHATECELLKQEQQTQLQHLEIA